MALLRDDPESDWEQIDIDALRAHLVGMDNVTVTFELTGDTTIARSVQRMVLAHSPMLQQATSWSVMAEKRPDGATMQVQLTSNDKMYQITGLGFFGLMTIGAHHQQHHFMIVMGHSQH